jgi:hypothetical protein
VPATAAFAAAPVVSPIADMTISVGATAFANIGAWDSDNDVITLTASFPPFVGFTAPPAAAGWVGTEVDFNATAADVGTHSATIYATAGGEADTVTFQITVKPVGTDTPPRVTSLPLAPGMEGTQIIFMVDVSDLPYNDPITSLTVSGAPSGSTFTTEVDNTHGTFTWTPTAAQVGEYDLIFSATDSTGVGSSTTHISVHAVDRGPITIAPIADVTLAEGETMNVSVNVSDPDSGAVNLTASLPAFATLNPPTSETGLGSLATTVTIAPGAGTAGTYTAWVTAMTGSEAATDTFMITVTGAAADFQTHASMIGNFNPHRKKICFRIRQEDAGFDLGKADLFSVMLHWQGKTLAGSSKLETSCEDGDDDEGECDDCDHHGDGDDDDAARLAAAHDSTDCDNECEIEGLRTCFTMDALRHFFGDANVPSSLRDATLEGELSTGETFVATLGDFKAVPHGDDGQKGDSKKGPLTLRVKPNPLNPKADISFTLTRAGHVTIAIYDLQGRLVRRVLDENRTVGVQSVAWSGSDNSERRVASGTYFVRIQAPQGEEVRAVRVVK